MNYIFKEFDSLGLSPEYNTLLDENSNPDLKAKCKQSSKVSIYIYLFMFLIFIDDFFILVERIDRDKEGIENYVYYG